MSSTTENTKCDLPPNVRGKTRGTLKLTILDIIPSSPSSVTSGTSSSASSSQKGRNPINAVGSGGVSVKFTWWGQSHENSATVIYNPAQKPNKSQAENPCVEYSIKTSAILFQNYLTNCEPVEVKLTSKKSNLQVGTAFMKIPRNLVENCSKGSAEETQSVKIFSPRNVALGEIRLKYNMLFEVRPDSAQTLSTVPELKAMCPGKENELLFSSRSCKSIKSDVNNCISSLRQKYTRPSTATSSNSLSTRALDYLTGRKMTQEEQNKALEEIQSSSPLESLVTELTTRLMIPARDVYTRIDSLRLSIKWIAISPAGVRELESPHLEDTSFTIESHISPNLLGNVRGKYDYDVMRFYSDHVDEKEKKVFFNRDAIRSIRISEYVDNAYIRFTIWTRPFGSKYSRCFGTAMYQFASLLETGGLEHTKKLTIKSCTDKTCVGYATVKVTLGTKGVHFGEDFMTIMEDTNFNEDLPTSRSRNCKLRKDSITEILGKFESSCKKCNNNETNKIPSTPNSSRGSNTTERSYSARETSSHSKNNQTENDNSANITKPTGEKDNRQSVKTDSINSANNHRLLQGLLYVGSIRNVRELQNGGYFLVCRAFWKEDATSTDFCQNYNFNFLETFPVINNDAFLERTRNNHLDLELWQKFTDAHEQLVGVVKLPLHQFFIAFRDNVITNHLCQAKLPVISIDGWVTITSPLSAESCGQMQALLAIGTEEQLEYLKISRGLCLNRVCDKTLETSQNKIPVPQIVPTQKSTERSTSSCDAESQTNFADNNHEDVGTPARRERLSDLLGNFIDSLAQKLPANQAAPTMETPILDHQDKSNSSTQGSQVRRTSELLDVLQKALVTPPTNFDGASNASTLKPQPSLLHSNYLKPKFVKILLEIENALHLPRNPAKFGNKKVFKRNNNAGKCKQSRLPVDEEPSAYVTFQAEEGSGQMIKSHEGMVYSTNVVEKSCSPIWNRRFEIYVPADLMKNDEKRFILKIWRKRVTDLAQCRLLPTPMEDAIIGFAAVDLNVLLAGMPCIAGWFNIVDFNGRINGQIKVNVRPLEDILKFKDPPPSLAKPPTAEPMNISENMIKSAQPSAALDMNNSMLSRAIKRKFTELEEITERLRARLLDVTGAPEAPISIHTEEMPGADPNDAQLDEFEHDLNTSCDEDNNGEQLDNFGWLGLSNNPNTSGQGDSDISTSDSQERIQMISEFLRKTDLNNQDEANTLIHRKERNPPEGETASSVDKTHVD